MELFGEKAPILGLHPERRKYSKRRHCNMDNIVSISRTYDGLLKKLRYRESIIP